MTASAAFSRATPRDVRCPEKLTKLPRDEGSEENAVENGRGGKTQQENIDDALMKCITTDDKTTVTSGLQRMADCRTTNP